MTVRERILHRQVLLEDLYEYHFATAGQALIIEDFDGNAELRLAYQYLAEKGYVDLFVDEHGVNAQIRTAGIETVEAGRTTIH